MRRDTDLSSDQASASEGSLPFAVDHTNACHSGFSR